MLTLKPLRVPPPLFVTDDVFEEGLPPPWTAEKFKAAGERLIPVAPGLPPPGPPDPSDPGEGHPRSRKANTIRRGIVNNAFVFMPQPLFFH
jgi:hypothetical protein